MPGDHIKCSKTTPSIWKFELISFFIAGMLKKCFEWGDGNWEIKTPPDSKNIPQWELSKEVMPYMRMSNERILTTMFLGEVCHIIFLVDCTDQGKSRDSQDYP
eukprot:Gb_01041 [translate_table: standard]